MRKSDLIGLKPETATRRKQAGTFAGHRERLSDLTPGPGDAIVRSHTNNKYEKLAEMTSFSSLVRTTDNKKET